MAAILLLVSGMQRSRIFCLLTIFLLLHYTDITEWLVIISSPSLTMPSCVSAPVISVVHIKFAR